MRIGLSNLLTLVFVCCAIGNPACGIEEGLSPNFIIIFTDDQGYNDVGCFGSRKIDTPNIDRLARDGMRMTAFYSGASVCTPSRAALLTGCYPKRVGNLPVLFPRSDRGLNPDETTIAEVLKASGYRTACFGKWHLGHHHPFLPMQQGFDEYFGVPYSNDMKIDPSMKVSDDVVWREGISKKDFLAGNVNGPPLFEGNAVVECPADQALLTKRYTEKSLAFIRSAAKEKKPFFLYLPHTMPHIPLFASPEFQGKSDAGLYGDTLEEIDWSVGEIVSVLKELSIQDNTYVVYTSDNGPWNLKGNATDKVKGNMNRRIGGSAFPLKGYKFSRWEGGMRVPTVIWGPTNVLAGKTCGKVAASIDLMPTIAELAGAKLPDREIDGKSIVKLLRTPDAKSPHEYFFYRAEAVRDERWKLKGGQLYDLISDIGESKDVAQQHPAVMKRLQSVLLKHNQELTAAARKPGSFARPPQPVVDLAGWTAASGSWKFTPGKALAQSNRRAESLALGPEITETKYTVSVKARVKNGKEGFRLVIAGKDSKNLVRWSCGAFSNTMHSLMAVRNGEPTKRSAPYRGKLENKRWYDLSMKVEGRTVRCLIDGELVNEATFPFDLKGRLGLGSNHAAVEFSDWKVTHGERKIAAF